MAHAAAELIQLVRIAGLGRAVTPASSPTAASAPEPIRIPSLRSLLRDAETGDAVTRNLALDALRNLADSAGVAVPALERLLRSTQSEQTRSDVCNVLGYWGLSDFAARSALQRAREDEDPEIRAYATAEPGSGDQAAAKWILQAVVDPDPEVRIEALHRTNSLLSQRVPGARQLLEESLDDSAHAVREIAKGYLSEYEKRALERTKSR